MIVSFLHGFSPRLMLWGLILCMFRLTYACFSLACLWMVSVYSLHLDAFGPCLGGALCFFLLSLFSWIGLLGSMHRLSMLVRKGATDEAGK